MAYRKQTTLSAMQETLEKALRQKRELKHVEFKSEFDQASPGSWVEIIKDIVALANSGGGVLVFGLDSLGEPTGSRVESIATEDPADILNRIAKYIEAPSFEIEIVELEKGGQRLLAFIISAAVTPHIFQKPGTYDVGGGKQKTTFAVGTIYFRHGAKSEPGHGGDLRSVIDREVNTIKRAWLKGVRKVVQAPVDSEIVAVKTQNSQLTSTTAVQAVKDPSATPVLLTRDQAKGGAVFYHEEISEGIFDEIDNVIDANRALSKGLRRFCLGQPIYYRIYAERQHVLPERQNREMLLHAAISEFYAPGLFWMVGLPDASIAGAFLDLYKNPRSPQIHFLARIAPILGKEFTQWLFGKLKAKWGTLAQPHGIYWTFKAVAEQTRQLDYRLQAARVSAKSLALLGVNENLSAQDLLEDSTRAAALLSAACRIAYGSAERSDSRSIARNLDYLAYGAEIHKRAEGISQAITKVVGKSKLGEMLDSENDG
jgi:hypothetical protein